jgi:hypothetical protein
MINTVLDGHPPPIPAHYPGLQYLIGKKKEKEAGLKKWRPIML